MRKETKKKLWTEEKQTHDGRERCIMRGEGKRGREGERSGSEEGAKGKERARDFQRCYLL